MAVWLVVALAAAPLALTLTGALSGAGWEAQGSIAQQVRDELRRDFPELGAEAAVVVYTQAAPIAEDPSGLQALVAALQDAPGAASVVDPTHSAPDGRPDRARRADRDDPRGARRQPGRRPARVRRRAHRPRRGPARCRRARGPR